MKKWKIYFIISFLCMFILPCGVKATDCDYQQLAKLKKYANNIHYDYDYVEQNGTVKFRIRFTNISKYVILQDLTTGQTYTNVNEVSIGGLDAGKTYSFIVRVSSTPVSTYTYKEYIDGTWIEREYSSVFADRCENTELKKIYVTLPSYNPYYNLPVCDGLEDYDMCFKWQKHELSKEEFESQVMEYKKKQVVEKQEKEKPEPTLLEQVILLYTQYYYIPLALIIIVCGILIYREKRNEKMSGW
ncbi:MAG TPA: hypothetical protein IAD49_05000 [Candidatus Fimihabitans intestinipullorum]|uniref:Uncharacterized protein n=1 Tax=Candidatus Fimihabitans intestinipullorum TaxID=2840820 RepID=A0A9D1HV27_9BACT|nr:hypothetical protein [Candidatus Fimihabitans intestinipullorum]